MLLILCFYFQLKFKNIFVCISSDAKSRICQIFEIIFWKTRSPVYRKFELTAHWFHKFQFKISPWKTRLVSWSNIYYISKCLYFYNYCYGSLTRAWNIYGFMSTRHQIFIASNVKHFYNSIKFCTIFRKY